ncbi:hypothetical protein CROQUDRAFT_110790 [Cronartium quercuum f. sp. fusiforme G11]|uniref:Uncharacterized protein n=1 Tax=Cronartium quercuum f. sp. fusiforme G11 TaxID=708437 RepID=A0A9P6NAX2_9BASI|nr:hypothetical protein CROQUDRAFT_110790 [Cronartium quercuum f. sp. fusiforme G11]
MTARSWSSPLFADELSQAEFARLSPVNLTELAANFTDINIYFIWIIHLDPNTIALDIFQGQLITCALDRLPINIQIRRHGIQASLSISLNLASTIVTL